jgi:hypothetical protein
MVYGKSMSWLGLIFAVLGSGIQSSELPRKERQMKSQVYICCAYECLRIVNYYTQTTLEDLQVLLVLGKVISNNMNAGTSWSLLGKQQTSKCFDAKLTSPPRPDDPPCAKHGSTLRRAINESELCADKAQCYLVGRLD